MSPYWMQVIGDLWDLLLAYDILVTMACGIVAIDAAFECGENKVSQTRVTVVLLVMALVGWLALPFVPREETLRKMYPARDAIVEESQSVTNSVPAPPTQGPVEE